MPRHAAPGALSPSRRRALVVSALGPLAYRVPASCVVAFAAAHDNADAGEVYAAGRAWAYACRLALDAGEALPTAAELSRADAATQAIDADALDDPPAAIGVA